MGIFFGKRRGEHAAFFKAVAEQVAHIQERTAVSLAVVIRGHSGNYRDVAFLFGALLAWLGLLCALYLPHELHPSWIPLDMLALFALGAWLGARTRLRVWLTSWRRRRRQVRTAAHAAFVEEELLHAREDRSLLIYWSVLERRVEVVAGMGLLTAVPPEAWHAFVFHVRAAPRRRHPAAAMLERLRELGALLARHLPPAEPTRGLPLTASRVAP